MLHILHYRGDLSLYLYKALEVVKQEHKILSSLPRIAMIPYHLAFFAPGDHYLKQARKP